MTPQALVGSNAPWRSPADRLESDPSMPDQCDRTWRRGVRSTPTVAPLGAVGIPANAASIAGGLALAKFSDSAKRKIE
jgi:hypothetical protein